MSKVGVISALSIVALTVGSILVKSASQKPPLDIFAEVDQLYTQRSAEKIKDYLRTPHLLGGTGEDRIKHLADLVCSPEEFATGMELVNSSIETEDALFNLKLAADNQLAIEERPKLRPLVFGQAKKLCPDKFSTK